MIFTPVFNVHRFLIPLMEVMLCSGSTQLVIIYKPIFSSTRTWDQIRERKTEVLWTTGVWFSQGVPRFSFIVWLAVRNRLSTGDRMRVWGIQQGCVLCGEPDETRDHLFFACPYSFTVWDKLVNRLTGSRTDPDWMITLQFVRRNNLRSLDKILLKMAFQACVYYLWKERNDRRHNIGSAQLSKS